MPGLVAPLQVSAVPELAVMPRQVSVVQPVALEVEVPAPLACAMVRQLLILAVLVWALQR